MKQATTKEKIAVYDFLVKEFKGRARCVGTKSVPVFKTKVQAEILPYDIAYVRSVPIFEWVLRADDVDNIEEALLRAIRLGEEL